MPGMPRLTHARYACCAYMHATRLWDVILLLNLLKLPTTQPTQAIKATDAPLRTSVPDICADRQAALRLQAMCCC
jgi:hypothetical protein